MDLSRVNLREKLPPKREPYWQRISQSRFLGFRPSKKGKGGTWIARYYNPDEGKQLSRSLGDYGHMPANERQRAALKDAVEWQEHVGAGGASKPITVLEACEEYAKGRPDAEKRFTRYVYSDPIAKILLPKLTDRHVRDWRKRLEKLPARVTRGKGPDEVTKKRSSPTLNRDMVCFRAALNAAFNRGDALTARAWRSALKPAETVSNRRDVYLDREQRLLLLDHLPNDCALFARALCLLPLRPGAVSEIKVGDFDHRRHELIIRVDKEHAGRNIILPASASEFFKQQTRSKLPGACLFTRADGKAWNKDLWKKPIKAAVQTTGLPPKATIYSLRHSVITDLVTCGLDLMTVATLAGTSILMIQKHYGHMQREHAAKALAALTL